MIRAFPLFLGAFLLSGAAALAETYYVAPKGAVINGTPDGTENLPFPSVTAAFASGVVTGGDVLLLKDGSYGSITIRANAAFDTPVTIMSQNGKGAHFDTIDIRGDTRNLTLRNLSVWPTDPATDGKNYLVQAYGTTSNIVIDGFDVRSEEAAHDYMQWDEEHWKQRNFSGILLHGPQGVVTNSQTTGVHHGIMVGHESKITNSVVLGFNGDGMRAGSNSLIQHNNISDCVKIGGNHDDGIQALGASNLTIDSNVITEWSGAANHPLRCALQGIGMFDGPYKDLTITDNIVSVTAIHGISVYGAEGATITGNTVVNSDGEVGKYPYIAVRPLKDGTPSTDVLVADNRAMSIQVSPSAKDGIQVNRNSVIRSPVLVLEELSTSGAYQKVPGSIFDMPDEGAVIPPAVSPPVDVPPISPVPIPSAGLLLIGGLGGLVALGRRKSRERR